jgi:hypothetical protein
MAGAFHLRMRKRRGEEAAARPLEGNIDMHTQINKVKENLSILKIKAPYTTNYTFVSKHLPSKAIINVIK